MMQILSYSDVNISSKIFFLEESRRWRCLENPNRNMIIREERLDKLEETWPTKSPPVFTHPPTDNALRFGVLLPIVDAFLVHHTQDHWNENSCVCAKRIQLLLILLQSITWSQSWRSLGLWAYHWLEVYETETGVWCVSMTANTDKIVIWKLMIFMEIRLMVLEFCIVFMSHFILKLKNNHACVRATTDLVSILCFCLSNLVCLMTLPHLRLPLFTPHLHTYFLGTVSYCTC